jgi:hypothetical protein
MISELLIVVQDSIYHQPGLTPSNNEVREIIANHCNGWPKLQNLLGLLAEIVIL